MDTLTLPREEMRKTLEFLEITNVHFGGLDVVLSYLNDWTVRWPANTPMTILDVGTGGADIPLALHAWGQKKKIPLSITGIDIVPEVVEIAQENTAHIADIKIERVDVRTLAWSGKQFDFVVGSLFLHHVPPEKQLEILGMLDQLAKRGVIVSDLARSVPSYVGVSMAAALMGNGIVRHDGPLSVRRAFTAKELDQMAKNAGLTYLKARREPWCRVSLAGEKLHA